MDKYSYEESSPTKVKFTLPARIEKPQRKSRYTTTTIVRAEDEHSQQSSSNARPVSSLDPHFELSAKLVPLRLGLIKDTVPIKSKSKLKPLKGFQWYRNGKLHDPLEKRGKMFRKAVAKFGPPYYCYIRELLETKSDMTAISQERAPDVCDTLEGNHVTCGWCGKTVVDYAIDEHKTSSCARRGLYINRGYFECVICKKGFIEEEESRQHIAKHYPKRRFENELAPMLADQRPKDHAIVCRDHAKRRKWI